MMSCGLRFFFFQAEDGIRDAQESRGLGDVYKRQTMGCCKSRVPTGTLGPGKNPPPHSQIELEAHQQSVREAMARERKASVEMESLREQRALEEQVTFPLHYMIELAANRELPLGEDGSPDLDVVLGQHMKHLNQKNRFGRTPLLHAVMLGQSAIVQTLLKAPGIRVADTDEAGEGVLHYAIGSAAVGAAMIPSLIQAGAPIDGRSDFGRTALHDAVIRKNLQGFHTLLGSGASIHATDKNGHDVFGALTMCTGCSPAEDEVAKHMAIKLFILEPTIADRAYGCWKKQRSCGVDPEEWMTNALGAVGRMMVRRSSKMATIEERCESSDEEDLSEIGSSYAVLQVLKRRGTGNAFKVEEERKRREEENKAAKDLAAKQKREEEQMAALKAEEEIRRRHEEVKAAAAAAKEAAAAALKAEEERKVREVRERAAAEEALSYAQLKDEINQQKQREDAILAAAAAAQIKQETPPPPPSQPAKRPASPMLREIGTGFETLRF
eukprot:TRINITY_DN45100_c0_g2_i1.p1 TRINITY_DN45100_c0_g2~~TRINITY_DN45100_c0_g2_i1.p1  ORF type:complete len:497 (+),score=160.38 TRINITY_DN45100_c0_g2_i1:56-1546(+)